ncbi:MAG TPA: hypothetical protein VJH63_03890, partial [Candidatus Paceibacterota bacterium]
QGGVLHFPLEHPLYQDDGVEPRQEVGFSAPPYNAVHECHFAVAYLKIRKIPVQEERHDEDYLEKGEREHQHHIIADKLPKRCGAKERLVVGQKRDAIKKDG